MFKGSIVALITPFREESFDEAAYRSLIEWHLEDGTDGFVACGTTGESPTLSHDEHRRVVEACIAAAAGRAPVIAGTGSNSTAEAIALTQHAEKAGADAVLVVTPYYNKPGQEGLYRHFKAIHDASGVPIIIYNIPGRCVIDMSVETMARLFELKNIAGVILIALNDRGEVTLLNPKGYQVLGYEEGDLTGRDWFKICLPEDAREEAYAVFRQLMAGDLSMAEYVENPVLTRSGEKRTIAWHNRLLKDDDGRVIGTLSSVKINCSGKGL